MNDRISISIVSYRPSISQLSSTLDSLVRALDGARRKGLCSQALIVIVDNGSGEAGLAFFKERLPAILAGRDYIRHEILSGHGNIGYGRGHNLALDSCDSDYHLILNPDVDLADNALIEAWRFMGEHPEIGLLSPQTTGGDGYPQYLCKRYPSLLVLFLRAWAPKAVQSLFAARLDHYEMRDCYLADSSWFSPVIVSGCFMFYRSEVFRRCGGFSPDYFLYFEDFDISIRTAEITGLAHVPEVRIIHRGGHAARKGLGHVWMFIGSGIKFFAKHGLKIC